jgi:ribosomal protein L37AE/L43A
MNGKGKGPEKGRNLPKYRDGWDRIFKATQAKDSVPPQCPICGNGDAMVRHGVGKWHCHRTHPL